MRHRQRSAPRKTFGQLELLEQRTMLDGKVAAFVNGAGDFVVKGDAADNAVWIKQDYSHDHGDNAVWIWGGNDTAINGKTYTRGNPLGISGLTRDVSVSLGDGNDKLYSYGVQAPRNLNVYGRDGHDDAYVDQGSVGGNLRFIGGLGHDDIYIDSVNVTGILVAQGHDGRDRVYVSDSGVGRISINVGPGNDGVYIQDVQVEQQGRILGGTGGKDYLGTEQGYDTNSILDGSVRVQAIEEFGANGPPNIMDVKLDQAIHTLRRPRSEEQHDQALSEMMEALFVSNLVPLPTDTNGNQNDPDEQDFQEHLGRMDDAITALNRHINSAALGTPDSKADAADARNFLQLTQEALSVIAGQTAFCNPADEGGGEVVVRAVTLTGPGCPFLQANDEGGATVDQVLQNIFSRQVRSPFPIIFESGSLLPNEQVIPIQPLADGECGAIVKEIQGIKAVVSPRLIPIWVEPWFARARIVGFETTWVFEFVPAEFIKTISVCNNGGSVETNVDSVVVHDRALMHFWRFLNKDVTAVA